MQELLIFFTDLVTNFGYPGLFLITFLEGFILPIIIDPFIIGATSLGMTVSGAVITTSIASVLGGSFGYFLGKTLGHSVAVKIFSSKVIANGEKLFKKWGIWVVFIGAISPIPYKIVAWLAGILEMRYSLFLLMSILGRVPRYIIMAYFGSWIADKFF